MLACCLIYGSASGQIIGKLYESTIYGKNGIVRFDPVTAKHIICPDTSIINHRTYFAMTDFNNLLNVKVADNLAVRDFEIIDRLVFFCGHTLSNHGFLGWFNIDSLFYFNSNAHIDTTMFSLGITDLQNIEVYYDSAGYIHIAGYGLKINYLAFEAYGNLTSLKFRILELPKTGPRARIVDLTVTDNYAVLLQHDQGPCYQKNGFGIALHPFPKNDMFPLPPPYHYYAFQTVPYTTVYTYSGCVGMPFVLPLNDDPCHGTNPLVTHIKDNKIMVCSYRRDFDLSSWDGISYPPCDGDETPCGGGMARYSATSLALRSYDLSPLAIGNPILMTSAIHALMPDDDVLSLDGFEYDQSSEHYIALHRQEISGIDEHAVTTFDFSLGTPLTALSSYQTFYDTHTQWLPHSLCLTPNNEYTVCGHLSSPLNYDYIFWHNSVFATSPSECDKIVSYPIDGLPLDVCKDELNFSKPSLWFPLVFTSQKREEETIEVYLKCE